jgi:hypothetical protein
VLVNGGTIDAAFCLAIEMKLPFEKDAVTSIQQGLADTAW